MEKQPTRVCSRCRRDLPIDCYYKSKRGAKKLDYWCKECKEEQRRERLQSTPPPPPNTKTCTKCGRELPLTAFGREPKGKNGRKSACKECHNAEQRERTAQKAKEAQAPVVNTPPVCLRLDSYLMAVQSTRNVPTPEAYTPILQAHEAEARQGNCQFSHRCPDRKQCPVAKQTPPTYRADNPKLSRHDPNYKRRQPLED